LEALTNQYRILSKGIEFMKTLEPGKVKLITHNDKFVNSYGTNSWEEVAAALKTCEEAFKEIKKGLDQPVCRFSLNHDVEPLDMPTPHLSNMRSVARWLSVRCTEKLHSGDLDGALEDIEYLFKIGRLGNEEPMLIQHLVTIAIDSIAFSNVWNLLQESGINENQLRKLNELLENTHNFENYSRAFEFERIGALDTFSRLHQLNSNSDSIKFFMSGDANENPASLSLKWGLFAHKIFYLYKDELHYLELSQEFLTIIRSGAEDPSYRQCSKKVRVWDDKLKTATKGLKKYEFILTSLVLPSYERTLTSNFRCETTRQIILAVVELKLYQLKLGNYPMNLNQLVPLYCERTPIDPMDGNSLRYKLNADGSFLLYSVGENFIDDGGDPNPIPNSKNTSAFWEKLDVVYPEPASSPFN
jgi:hypothetical protein